MNQATRDKLHTAIRRLRFRALRFIAPRLALLTGKTGWRRGLQPVRIMLSLYGVGYFAIGLTAAWLAHVYYPVAVYREPLWQDFGILVIFASVAHWGRRVNWLKRRLEAVAHTLLWLVSAHLLYVAIVNQMTVIALNRLVLGFFMTAGCFAAPVDLVLFTVYFLSASITAIVSIPQAPGTVPDRAAILTVVTVVSFSGASLVRKLRFVAVQDQQLRKNRRLVESVSESRERIQIALEAGQMGTIQWNVKTGETARSARTIEITEIPSGEDAQRFFERLAPEDHDRVVSGIETARKTRKSWRDEFRIECNGRIKWVLESGAFTYDDKGEPSFFFAVIQDITERRENAIKLEEQQKMMLGAARLQSLGELSSNIGHEINTPLTRITTNATRLARLVERGEFHKEKILEICRNTMDTVAIASDIVQGLRQLSSDRPDDVRVFSLRETLQQALSISRGKFSDGSIRLLVDVNKTPKANCQVQGNPVQLFQVVVNLLNNAYDAVAMLGPGEPRWVKMDLTCDGQDLYLSVTDSGHKISSDVHANLFQRFYTTKPLGQGTGLGLYLSRRIVESHHGQIWHDTDHPHTRFVVKLPQYQGYARSSHVEQGQAI